MDVDWSDLPPEGTRFYRVAKCRDELALFIVEADMCVDGHRRIVTHEPNGLSAWATPRAPALRVHSRVDVEEDDDLLALQRPVAELFEYWRLFSCPREAFREDAAADGDADADADADETTVPGWTSSTAADGHVLLHPHDVDDDDDDGRCAVDAVYHMRGCTTALAVRVHEHRELWTYHGVVTRWLSPTRMWSYLQSDAIVTLPQTRAVWHHLYKFHGTPGGFVYEHLYELLQDVDDAHDLERITSVPHNAARLAAAYSRWTRACDVHKST
jgi:hypothetical protein